MNAIVMHKEYYNSFATENVIVRMGNYILRKTITPLHVMLQLLAFAML